MIASFDSTIEDIEESRESDGCSSVDFSTHGLCEIVIAGESHGS